MGDGTSGGEAHDRFLGRSSPVQRPGNRTLMQHHDAVGYPQYFLEVAGNRKNRRSPGRQRRCGVRPMSTASNTVRRAVSCFWAT